MPNIHFPIRIGKKGLERCEGACSDEAGIVHLIAIMARTARSCGWIGCKEFGLRDFFEEMGPRHGLQTDVIRAANRALEDLGIEWFRIESIVRDRELPNGAEFSITVSLLGKGTRVIEGVTLGSD